jgi:creatinine amidohydrolase
VFREHRRSPTGGEYHAGELETAVQLHLRPELVRLDDHTPVHIIDPARDFGVSGGPADLLKAGSATVGYKLSERFPTGVMGDPTVATAELGERVFTAIVERLGALVDEYRGSPPAPDGFA